MRLVRLQPGINARILEYFKKWKLYKTIVEHLRCEGFTISLRTLKRILHTLRLFRRGQYIERDSVTIIKECVLNELHINHGLQGYRAIWKRLWEEYGVVCKRSMVQMLLALLDPEGCTIRRHRKLKRRLYFCKGPNYVWHLDQNDKLRKYGFCLHACIDGYFCMILWLEIASTNRDPQVICKFFLDTVGRLDGCPRLVRSDYGTENCYLAACQMALRHNHQDIFAGDKAYRYGKSTTNTRIESWWSRLKEFKLSWWIDYFEQFINSGVFNPNNIAHKHCLTYCHAHILQDELQSFVKSWNSHPIRKNHLTRLPSGVPEDLYYLPHLQGTQNYQCDVDPCVWLAAYSFARTPAEFYPVEFAAAASAVLRRGFGIEQNDITIDIAYNVFIFLVDDGTVALFPLLLQKILPS